MGFADNLLKLLRERNLKQAQLCRMTGIQTSLMSDYIGGKKSPTIGNAILIADALHISLDALVGKEPDPERETAPAGHALTALWEEIHNLPEEELLFLLDTVQALKRRLGADIWRGER